MKICFYFGVFARYGGIEEFTKDLALALGASGVEVQVLCASLRNPILDELRSAGVEVVAIPMIWGCRWNLPDYILLPWALAKMKNADVVIHQKPFRSWIYSLLSHKPKHVFITAYHPEDQFGSGERIRSFFSFFSTIFTQATDFKVALLSSGLALPVHVLPYIPPRVETRLDKTSPGGVVRVGMMGRVENQKNPLYALDIVQVLSSGGASDALFELHVYGSGSLEQELKEKAEESGVKVLFYGCYGRNAVPEIVSENDLFLITSISEGQCIVALEILAGGRPLFATPVGALPDILKDEIRGSLLPVSDAEEAATIISTWLAEHADVSAADIRQSYLSRFDREKIERRYVECIEQLVTVT